MCSLASGSANVISTVGAVEVYLTPPHARREEFLTSARGKPLASGGEHPQFAAACAVARWCTRLRLRLLAPGSATTEVGIGRVVLRVDRSSPPPPPPGAAAQAAQHADGGGGGGGGALDMNKVEALMDGVSSLAVLSCLRKLVAGSG